MTEENNVADLRERRRRKILMRSEDRMKKIMGVKSDEVDGDIKSFERSSQDADISLPSTSCRTTVSKPAPENNSNHNFSASQSSNQDTSSLLESLAADASQPEARSLEKLSSSQKSQQAEELAFRKFRTFMCCFVGVLIRLSFLYKFGEVYVQTIFNPFFAMEIAMVGFQRATGMDLAGNVAGGMWLSALLLCGVNPNIVNSYKTLMGVITNVTEDFALFFFGFVVTHLIHEFTV